MYKNGSKITVFGKLKPYFSGPPKSLAILLQSLHRVLMTVSISEQDKVCSRGDFIEILMAGM